MPVTIHTNEEIRSTALKIEEHIFRNCRVINCVLVYDGGPFEWANTSFQDCQWSFREAAKNTLQLLQTIGLLTAQQTPPSSLPGSSTVN